MAAGDWLLASEEAAENDFLIDAGLVEIQSLPGRLWIEAGHHRRPQARSGERLCVTGGTSVLASPQQPAASGLLMIARADGVT
jgi:hypothetical protein